MQSAPGLGHVHRVRTVRTAARYKQAYVVRCLLQGSQSKGERQDTARPSPILNLKNLGHTGPTETL